MTGSNFTRRSLMLGLGAGAALAPGFAGLRAEAAAVGGYKALVCVFLFGGLDHNELLIPFDAASHEAFVDQRRALAGENRSRAALLELAPRNADRFGERRFALPPELGGIKQLFDAGEASIIANVGPLTHPITRSQWDNDTAQLPPRLFSHNDQQSIWQASAPEGARFGWGGLFADAALISGANRDAEAFSTVSTAGDNLFLTGRRSTPFSVGSGGPAQVRLLKDAERRRNRNDEAEAAYQRLRRHFAAHDFHSGNLIAQDVARVMAASLANNEAYQTALETPPALGVAFPDTRLGRQLEVIAETIAVRSRLGADRQVFFAGTGGFDTHSDQAQDIPGLLGNIDACLVAFHTAMANIGAGREVTLFTGSDFGRTFSINGDGTDHGWGGHHIVLGGDVDGGRIVGDPPPPGFEHAWDAGRGRLIPQISVEQYAADLGRWFGLSQPDLDAALPNLVNFDSGPRVMV